FAERRALCLLFLFVAPIVLRLVLLPVRPVPVPDVYDAFGHLLVADTLRHWRLANPPHPLSQFFETFFVLQTPAYSSIYPLGQGIVLALGRALFGLPWVGVLATTGLMCAAVYWMLLAWTTPVWALAGGLLAIAQFGPLSLWMNDYWGGSVAALAGCLVFGSLPRLSNTWSVRHAVSLAAGLSIHWLTRPYESLFLFASVGLFLLWRRISVRSLSATALLLVPAAALTLLHNWRVTGSAVTLPYQLSQYQYGVPASVTFQQIPVPHRPLTPQQQLGYRMQAVAHGPGTDSVAAYVRRFLFRLRSYRFFFMPPLYLALLAFLVRCREPRWRWVLATFAVFMLGENFYPYFHAHYLAALTGLCVLVSVVGLEVITRWSALMSGFVMTLCAAYFVFWYGAQVGQDGLSSGSQSRIAVNRQLAGMAGRKLVFVRYSDHHVFQNEWVYNEADIDSASVVWARDLGPEENEKLRGYYHDRTVWLLEPDEQPPSLSPYAVEQTSPSAIVHEPAQAEIAEPVKPEKKLKPSKPTLRFEDVK
ncbi:MAG: hypothetical protein JO022_04315, partial [Acidobacteriaceae bacterium]|nr:hypothetical protein [Acidobacteriaceae bacterium]